LNLFDSMPISNTSSADLAGIARQAGWQVDGSVATRPVKGTMGGIEEAPLSMFQGQSSGPSFLEQGLSLAKAEAGARQGAADRGFQRNQAAQAGADAFTGQIGAKTNQIANEGSSYLDDLMGGLGALSSGLYGDAKKGINDMLASAVGNYNKSVSGIDSAVKGLTETYNKAGDDAIAEMRRTVSKYSTGIDEQAIGNTVAGIRADTAKRRKSIEAGYGPNGQQLTASERQQALRDLNNDVSNRISSVASSVRSHAQETLASLGTHLADITLQAGQLKGVGAQAALTGEGMKEQAGQALISSKIAGIQSLLSSQEGVRSLAGLIASMGQFRTNLRSSSQLNALQQEQQGREWSAQYSLNNPETVVSVLSAFLALGGVATSPGGRNIPGL